MKLSSFFSICLIGFVTAQEPIKRVACGSCYNPNRDKVGIWNVIAKDQAQAFLFMGDNIYGDTEDMEVLKQKWTKLTSRKDYTAFKEKTPIMAVWDDHDYGKNDAGHEYPKKKESLKIFRDVFGQPHSDVEGVYHSNIMGPKGKRLRVIMLDTRYHRSKLLRGKVNGRNGYLPLTEPKATILGEDQWTWLAAELRKPAELRLIVSSIQVLSNKHRFEKWENIPAERARLLALLKHSKCGPTILLSGDRHLAEICKMETKESGLPYDLYELTTSGMSHAGSQDGGSKYRLPGTYSKEINYGLLDLDWSTPAPAVSISIKNGKGEISSTTKIKFP